MALLFEERTFGPFVERAHRRAAPYLIIEAARWVAGIGPARGQAKIPTKHEGHFMFGVAVGTLYLSRVTLEKESACLVPDFRQGRPKQILFDMSAFGRRQGFQAGISPV